MTKNNLLVIPDEVIINKIYLIREQKVMLDRDLAVLYGVKPFRLREQVKRNIKKFPERFMFHATDKEVDLLVSQNAIPSRKHLGGFLPYAFTEHGVLMLANVLKSEMATQVSIYIIDIFIKLRKVLTENLSIRIEVEAIKKKLENQEKNIELVFSYLDELIEKQENPKPRKRIGFKTGNNND